MHELSFAFEPVREVLRRAQWPGVEEGLSRGTPALKLKGKMVTRIREPGVLVLLCDFEKKAFLMQAAPEIYFEIDHYKGYPAVLARLGVIELDELQEMIEFTWRSMATKQQIAEYEARRSAYRHEPHWGLLIKSG